MEKINVMLVVLNQNALEHALESLDFANANLIAIIVEDGNGQLVTLGDEKFPLVSFSAVAELAEVGKELVWLIICAENEGVDFWRFKNFLMNFDIPEDKIVDVNSMVSRDWLANLRHVEKYGADFFATGMSQIQVGLDLRYIPHEFGKGVNFAGLNQDLTQSYQSAKYVFDSVAPGTIKFVLIGLAPYSFRYDKEANFSVCSQILLGDGAKKIFAQTTAEDADLNLNRIKKSFNAPLSAKMLTDWKAELDNVTKKLRPNVVEKNLQILKDYIKLCLQNGAKPVGVIFPFAPIIRQNYDEKLLTLFRLAIRQLEESYDFTCVNLFDLKLGYDCFYNMAHLNLRGAAFASAALGLQLYEKDIVATKDFVAMNYSYFLTLGELLPPNQYNALLAGVFGTSAEMIRRKNKISVGFVLYDSSMWCGDELYNFFARDRRFEPTIFLCLRTDYGDKELMQKDFLHGVEQLKSRGLNVMPVLERNAAVPAQDVLIFLTPYFEVLPHAFRPEQMTARTLLIHIPYGFGTSQWYDYYNYPLMYLSWKNFIETKTTLKLFQEKCAKGNPRGIYSGYPKLDVFFDTKHKFKFNWKTARRKFKKIIWAPHWSIDDGVKYATFQWNYQFMYDFARAHPEISWVVKPHPNLLFSAVRAGLFPSTEAFESYLQAWNDLPNAQVCTGAYYQALFATSDGMIQDSGSFIAEYQYTHKPMIFLTRDTQKFNDLSNGIMNVSYLVDGRDLNGIAELMQKIFIEGNDPLKAARQKFFDENLNYQKYNGMTASEFIFKNIADELNT